MSEPCFISNATIYYTQNEVTTTGLDPITGMPVFTASPELELQVSIEAEETEPKFLGIEGAVDEIELRVGGRCMVPKQLPREIKPGNNYRIRWRYGLNYEIEGRIHILPSFSSRFDCLDNYFGDRILGTFVSTKNNRVTA